MRSVVLKDVKKFEVVEREEPIKSNGKVIIDVKKSGICGSDIHYWVSGNPKELVLGHEFAGVITDNGNNEAFKIGDRVTALPISPCGVCEACKSGNPQYCRVTWDNAVGLSLTNPGGLAPKLSVRSDMVYKLPDNMSFEEGAMVEPVAVGLHAVHLAKIEIGAKVLVIGGGIIGLVSSMFAKKAGASLVVVSETNEKRGEKAVSLRVSDEWYNAKDPNYIENLMKKTNGGFDVVIECVGNAPAVNSAFTLVKPGGTVVLVGVAMDAINIYTVMSVMKELTVQGAIGYTKEEFKTCIDLISNKSIEVTKFIDDIVGLDGVQSAYERLTSGIDPAVKILVDPIK